MNVNKYLVVCFDDSFLIVRLFNTLSEANSFCFDCTSISAVYCLVNCNVKSC